jgi:hypothetical protein
MGLDPFSSAALRMLNSFLLLPPAQCEFLLRSGTCRDYRSWSDW